MRRARTIIGLPIISLDEGVRVGRVRDLVFDPDNRAIAALVVNEPSWGRDAELIPVDRVRSFGRDAVTIHSLRAVIKARSRRDLDRLYRSGVTFDGLLVMTEGGNYLGLIDEVILDDHAGVVAYEISTGFAKDVNQGKCQIPADEALTVGRDVALFPDGVESLVLQPSAIVAPAEERNPAELVHLRPARKSA
jgi:uncharacterized protein YrrD